jgi:hypothetical protein
MSLVFRSRPGVVRLMTAGRRVRTMTVRRAPPAVAAPPPARRRKQTD